MFVKITRSGSRRYVQLVEAFRDAEGRPRQKTIATLGRLDQLDGELDALIQGLLRATGRAPLAAPEPAFESARALGDTWALTLLWRELKLDSLARLFRRKHPQVPVEALLRVMVFNRLCEPTSKLGILRWLETTLVPGVATESITHDRLLAAMDALMDEIEAVEACLSELIRPLLDTELSVVFYDLTTVSACAEGDIADADLRRYGRSKDGGIARQWLLGVVQTAEGLPIAHQVFPGNTAEVPTLLPLLERLLERCPIQRVILVADRGLLSLDNVAALEALTVPRTTRLEYILAVPARRYAELADPVAALDFSPTPADPEAGDRVRETTWQDRRLIVAHDALAAATQTAERASRLAEVLAQGEAWAQKLEAQDQGERFKGRKLTDKGAALQFHTAVVDAGLSRIVRLDLDSPLFAYDVDTKAKACAELFDGKLILVTNVRDLPPAEVIDRYKALADIERGFRVLKSELDIAPMYHRLPQRIRAHAAICFIALVLHRILRQRLQASHTGISPMRCLETLRRIQHHRVHLPQQTLTGVSTLTPEQQELFAALNIQAPTRTRLETVV
ncbi:MAG TPA: IS1634 family transposase [Gammaproteobacteria bacterium]